MKHEIPLLLVLIKPKKVCNTQKILGENENAKRNYKKSDENSFRINTITSLYTLSILVEQFYKEENDKNKMMRS